MYEGNQPRRKEHDIVLELWSTNGTVAGTKLVKDIAPGYSLPTYQDGWFPPISQEDAEALVAALSKKNYAVFAVNTAPSDKLFHVQIGPFGNPKDAESLRLKLVGDGYNPIVKRQS